jgi:sugar phosphate isomerase/epimerase
VRAKPGAPTRAARPARGPVPVALSTASVYPQTCADAFGYAAALGYDGVEVMVWTDPLTQDAGAVASLAEHYGQPVRAVHAPTLLVTQRVWGKDPWGKLERACEMAATTGAGVVVVHPPFRWQRDYAARFVDGVRVLADRTGVQVAVENMFPWRAGARGVVAYAPGWDPLEHDYDAVTLDLSHAATAGADTLSFVDELGDKLAHLHLADGLGSAKDEHLVPGRGKQPCAEVLSGLAARGWGGTAVVEVNTRRSRNPGEREADLAEALAFARRHLDAGASAGRHGRAPAGAAGAGGAGTRTGDGVAGAATLRRRTP